MAEEKNVLTDKQKFGEHKETGQQQHEAEDKLKHMGQSGTGKPSGGQTPGTKGSKTSGEKTS